MPEGQQQYSSVLFLIVFFNISIPKAFCSIFIVTDFEHVFRAGM